MIFEIAGGAVSLTTTILLATYGTALAPGVGTLIGLGVGLAYEGLAWVIDYYIYKHCRGCCRICFGRNWKLYRRCYQLCW